MVWLTGKLISPGQSFHQWIHLGEETSAHLGILQHIRDCVIDSWKWNSGFCWAILPSCFHTRMWNHSSDKYTNTWSTLDFVYQTVLCCGRLLLQKWIFMPTLNGIYRLHTCACYYHEQMLITSFLFNFTWDVPHSLRWRPWSSSQHVGWKHGPLSCLLQRGFRELGNNWMQKSV